MCCPEGYALPATGSGGGPGLALRMVHISHVLCMMPRLTDSAGIMQGACGVWRWLCHMSGTLRACVQASSSCTCTGGPAVTWLLAQLAASWCCGAGLEVVVADEYSSRLGSGQMPLQQRDRVMD